MDLSQLTQKSQELALIRVARLTIAVNAQRVFPRLLGPSSSSKRIDRSGSTFDQMDSSDRR
jgi:hypothetical protein